MRFNDKAQVTILNSKYSTYVDVIIFSNEDYFFIRQVYTRRYLPLHWYWRPDEDTIQSESVPLRQRELQCLRPCLHQDMWLIGREVIDSKVLDRFRISCWVAFAAHQNTNSYMSIFAVVQIIDFKHQNCYTNNPVFIQEILLIFSHINRKSLLGHPVFYHVVKKY